MANPVPLLLLLVSLCSAFYNKTRVAKRNIMARNFKPAMCKSCINYREVVLNCEVFVDKSMLIKEVLESENKLFLITLPRRWGKSVQLRMIRNFFEIDVDKHGDAYHYSVTWAYSTFVRGYFKNFRGKEWFIDDNPLIGYQVELVDEHMSQWPVIYVKFNIELRENCHNILSGMMFLIRAEYAAHSYVTERMRKIIEDKKTNKTTRSIVRNRLNKFKDIRYNKIQWGEEDVKDSLRFLSEVLNDHFGQKVVIMIDDYHSLWDSLFLRDDFTENEQKKFFKFYSDFLERTFVNNSDMEFGFVVGLYRPPKEYFEKIFDRFVECNLMTGKFMEYFGFNQWEIETLFELFELNPFRQRNLTHLYDGYNVKNGSLTVFNPGSLVEFFVAETSFDAQKMLPYFQIPWCVKKLVINQLELDSFKARFFKLVNNESVHVRGDLYNYTWHELELLYGKPWPENEEIDLEWFADTAFTNLFLFGCLTEATGETEEPYKLLKIPNKEVLVEMSNLMEMYYVEKLKMNKEEKDFCKRFMKLQTKVFLNDNHTNCTEVREGYEFYIREPYSVYNEIRENNSDTEPLLHDILCYSLKDYNCVRKEMYPPSEDTSAPNVLLVLNDRAVSFKIKYMAPSVEHVLQEAIQQTDLSEIYEPVNTIQYVALNVLDIPDVEMCSEFRRIT